MSGEVAPKPAVEDDPKATITTGWPAASLPATCGSDPIDFAPPFGGRHGTRPRMSVADFATSFTLLIALLVMLLGADGLDGSTAATLPAPVVDACGFAVSVLALSESVACCAVCACTGRTHGGISSATLAAASAASH